MKALVTTGSGKFYSYGLDLEEMTKSQDGGREFLRTVHKLFNKILVFPKPTIAALNGKQLTEDYMSNITRSS